MQMEVFLFELRMVRLVLSEVNGVAGVWKSYTTEARLPEDAW